METEAEIEEIAIADSRIVTDVSQDSLTETVSQETAKAVHRDHRVRVAQKADVQKVAIIVEKEDSADRVVQKAETDIVLKAVITAEKEDSADRAVMDAQKDVEIVSKEKTETSAVKEKIKILADRIVADRVAGVGVSQQEEMMQMQYLHQN